MKQGMRVQALDALLGNDLLRVGSAIRSDHFTLHSIPQDKVPVVWVEAVKVCAVPGALSGGTERNLAQASDFLQHIGNFCRTRRVGVELGTCHQTAVLG